MKRLSQIILTATLMSLGSFTGVQASDKDNGGSLTAMQKARALSRDELIGYLTTKSPVLRRILEGLVLYVDPASISDAEVKAIVTKMNASTSGDLLDDVRYTNYTTDAQAFRNACGDSGRKDLCTENATPGATIYFNVDQLVEKRVSLGELVGLIMHEHSRHFACSADADHKLANFYMEAFFKNLQIGKTFTHSDGLRWVRTDKSTYIYGYAGTTASAVVQVIADAFCISKSYRRAAKFQVSGIAFTGTSGGWSLGSSGPVAWDLVGSAYYFSEILCTGRKSDD